MPAHALAFFAISNSSQIVVNFQIVVKTRTVVKPEIVVRSYVFLSDSRLVALKYFCPKRRAICSSSVFNKDRYIKKIKQINFEF